MKYLHLVHVATTLNSLVNYSGRLFVPSSLTKTACTGLVRTTLHLLCVLALGPHAVFAQVRFDQKCSILVKDKSSKVGCDHLEASYAKKDLRNGLSGQF